MQDSHALRRVSMKCTEKELRWPDSNIFVRMTIIIGLYAFRRPHLQVETFK